MDNNHFSININFLNADICNMKIKDILNRTFWISLVPMNRIKENEKLEDEEVYYCKCKEASAVGKLRGKEITVLRGSTANLSETKGISARISKLRKMLLKEGVLVKNNNVYEFTCDYTFPSLSSAAGVIAARKANGWVHWKDANKKTLDELKRK